jgi:glycosyltransferase involved in cell wall biosynthesis
MHGGAGTRLLYWHGWLLSGTGSNVLAANVVDAMRTAGNDVALVCQERHPERFPFVDAWAAMDETGAIGPLTPTGTAPAPGRVVALRPWIGPLLPVFVYDEYEGFDRVRPFVDLTDDELEAYLSRNVTALRAALAWHGSESVLAAHVVPGGPIAERACRDAGPGFSLMVHGSDLEYAVRPQERYARLAERALAAAHAVFGPTEEALDRTAELAPETSRRRVVVAPGVDVDRFRPGPRAASLAQAADLLEADGGLPGGRPAGAGDAVRAAVGDGLVDVGALDHLSASYDQTRPDADAAAKLRALAPAAGPVIGYLGKHIPQKGVHLLLAAVAGLPDARALLIGFGTWRDRFEALMLALDAGDDAAAAALWPDGDAPAPAGLSAGTELAARVTFTGRLDHRYSSLAVRAMDVLVVPSILEESFGMVAAEGAAAGALPLVARHSGLAEVAAALEDAAASPGLFSFEQDADAVTAIRDGARRLLELAPVRRARVATAVRARVASAWTWERAAARYIEAMSA